VNRAAAVLVVLALAACTGGAGGTGGAASSTAATSASAMPSPPSGGGSAVPSGGAASQPVASDGPAVGAACDLLTDADIERVTSRAILEKSAGPASGIFENGCEWTLEAEGIEAEPQIVLRVLGPGGRDYYDRYFAPFAEENGDEPLDGLGDVALLQDAGNVMTVAGDTLVSLQYAEFPTTDEMIPAELARAVLANLGS